MQLIKPLLAGAALLALTACAGPASPLPQTPVVTPVSTGTPTPGTTLTTPAQWLTPSATPTTGASATPSPSPSGASPSASPSVKFDSYPMQYKFAVLQSIVNVNGRMAAVLDPVTMCMRPTTDAACEAALGEAEWAVVNLNTRAYTVPFAIGATVKTLNSGQPNDYTASAPKPRTWTGSQRVVFEVVSNGSTLSSVTEWWHP